MKLVDKGIETAIITMFHKIKNVKQSMNIMWRKYKLENRSKCNFQAISTSPEFKNSLGDINRKLDAIDKSSKIKYITIKLSK